MVNIGMQGPDTEVAEGFGGPLTKLKYIIYGCQTVCIRAAIAIVSTVG